jgi:eukaryotic-like serine/threonine-protein kinase
MEGAAVSANIFRFGLFEADAAAATLLRSGVRVKIQDQPFRVLLLLLERPGKIVSREELRQRLWPEGTFVDFDGSLNVILKKLRAAIDDDSDNPRFIETVPRRGYRFVAPVAKERKEPGGVEAEPPVAVAVANRTYPTAATETPAQSAATVAEATALPPTAPAPRRPILVYAAAAVLLLSGAGGLLWHRLQVHADHAGITAHVQMRKSVAVLGFHSLSGRAEDSWLASALSEMLSTELAGGERLRLVSGEDVANLRIASPWLQTDTLDERTTARIGRALGSDLLVLGSYTTLGNADGGELRLDVRMQDARSGEILTEIAEIGSRQDLFRLVSRVGAKLRERLGVPPLEDADEAGLLASLPLDPDAARVYSLGVSKLRESDALGAKDLLKQATKADPKFSLAHAMLARAWAQLGYEQKRKDEAKKALDLSSDLPRADRMLVEGEYYDSKGNQEQAASVYHALYELFPDNVDYGLRFATAEILAGNASQALQVLHELRKLPAPYSDDPRIDLGEARAIKANRPASLTLIRNAISKASQQGKTFLYALAKKEECRNLLYGEHPDEAVPACEDAYNIFVAAGNRPGAADSIRLIADVQGSQGHFNQAIATYQRALALLSGLGEHEKTGAILNNMAINFANQGKLVRAGQLYQQAKSHFQQAGDKHNTATAICNMADILFLQGNLPGAEKLYQQTLNLIAATDHGDPAYAVYRLADLELTRGNVKDAHYHAQQAIDALRSYQGSYQYLTAAMVELGEALEAEGDLAAAQAQFNETLSIRQKLGAEDLVEESEVELAGLDIEEGHPEQAEPILRTAIAEFEKEKSDPDSSSAYSLLSRALLMQNRVEEARNAVERALQFSLTSSDPALKLPAAIQKARVEMASAGHNSSDSAAALQDLRSAIATARKLGYYNLETEARLAFAELQLRINASAGRALLAALASEARGRGLELLARHAQEALSSGNVLAANNSAR